jgi:tetrahydromethanopterin S-methyltransferase subunit F
VLDIAKIESGQFTLNMSEYAIESVVETVRAATESLAQNKKLTLTTSVDSSLPVGLERYRSLRAGLVVADLNCIGPMDRSVVGPGDVAVAHVLRSLMPLKADKSGCTGMRFAKLLERICKRVGLIARGGRLAAGVSFYALPRIVCRHQRTVESADDFPSTAGNVDGEVSLADSVTSRAGLQLSVNLVHGSWCN